MLENPRTVRILSAMGRVTHGGDNERMRVRNPCTRFNLAAALALTVLAAGASSCMEPDEVFDASSSVKLTTVTRQSDGVVVYDGCVVYRTGAPIPQFPAAPGDLLTEHVSVVSLTKRSGTFSAGMQDTTDDAYWCSAQDDYGMKIPESVGFIDCYRAGGTDPPAKILSATLEFNSSLPVAVTRSLQVLHSGTLSLEPNPPCPEPGGVPPAVDELIITE